MQIEHNSLYYIYDPMCSWCYAFEPCLAELQQRLPQQLNLKMLLGGLAPDTTEVMPAATQAMIQRAWQQIEKQVPNVRFNFDFWSKNTAYRSTYPACRAILAAQKQSPAFAEALRKTIQHAYYQQAKNPSLNAVLIDCAQQIALDSAQFSADLISPEVHAELKAQIQFSRALDVSSYPSLRLVLNNEIYPIQINYNDLDPTLTQIIDLLTIDKQNAITSPCVRRCCLDTDDMCLGCFRLIDEIMNWSYTSNIEKQAILHQAEKRKMRHTQNTLSN